MNKSECGIACENDEYIKTIDTYLYCDKCSKPMTDCISCSNNNTCIKCNNPKYLSFEKNECVSDCKSDELIVVDSCFKCIKYITDCQTCKS